MRVAFVIDRFEPDRGGAEAALEEFARALVERGDEVTFLVMRGEASPEAPWRVERLAVARHPRFLAEESFASRACREARSRFDVSVGFRHVADVDVFVPHGGLHTRAVEASLECGRGSVRARLRQLAHSFSLKQRLMRSLERRLMERNPPCVAVALSRRVLNDFTSAYPNASAQWHLVPGGVDLERFRPPTEEAERERARSRLTGDPTRALLLFVAHNARLKGLATLLQAIADPRLARVELFWIGRGRTPQWIRRARHLGVADRFQAFGPRDDTDILYRGADLLVHPTWHDPCSRVVLEALASGLPVVTTRRDGSAQVVLDAGGGIVIDEPGDPTALADAIERALRERETLVPRAREAAQAFSRERHLAELLGCVDRAAGIRERGRVTPGR